MRKLLTPLVAIPLVFIGLPTFAQSSPSADQIINSLKPSGSLLSGGTRGIRMGSAPVAPSPAVQVSTGQPRAAAPAPQAAMAAPSANLTVKFASGSTELTPQAIQALNELGRALSSTELAGYKFRIEGHTDTVGTPEANRLLSEQRAQVVVSFITSHFGIDAARLQAVGKGEDELAVQTPPQTPDPRNRRVVVVNLGA